MTRVRYLVVAAAAIVAGLSAIHDSGHEAVLLTALTAASLLVVVLISRTTSGR